MTNRDVDAAALPGCAVQPVCDRAAAAAVAAAFLQSGHLGLLPRRLHLVWDVHDCRILRLGPSARRVVMGVQRPQKVCGCVG